MPAIYPVFKPSINVLTHPRDIMKAVLRWYMENPDAINDTFYDEEISFIKDQAEFTGIEQLKEVVAGNLEVVLKRYFPSGNVSVEVDHSMVDDKYFSLEINMIVLSDGKTYMVGQNFKPNSDGRLSYDYNS